ncbi:MAG: hypothetical protein WCS85_00250 [Candidatus Peribacteraceae bacterium]
MINSLSHSSEQPVSKPSEADSSQAKPDRAEAIIRSRLASTLDQPVGRRNDC